MLCIQVSYLSEFFKWFFDSKKKLNGREHGMVLNQIIWNIHPMMNYFSGFRSFICTIYPFVSWTLFKVIFRKREHTWRNESQTDDWKRQEIWQMTKKKKQKERMNVTKWFLFQIRHHQSGWWLCAHSMCLWIYEMCIDAELKAIPEAISFIKHDMKIDMVTLFASIHSHAN